MKTEAEINELGEDYAELFRYDMSVRSWHEAKRLPYVTGYTQCQTDMQKDIDELVEFIDNNALKLGVIAQLKAVKLIQKHTKK